MNKREAAVISAFTGVLIGDFGDMHEYIEEIMHGPVWTHQLGDKDYCEKIKAASKKEFISISNSLTD
jgi:hypothetical protein